MAKHISLLQKIVNESMETLQRELDDFIDGIKVTDPIVIDIRESTMTLDHSPVVVRRVFLRTDDSKSLSTVGWVVKHNVKNCLDCLKKFTKLAWRHHCRACGIMVCAECSTRVSYVEGFEHLGRMRVCNSCNPKVKFKHRLFTNQNLR